MRTQRTPGRPLLAALSVAGIAVLACAGGDDVPEPWSRRDGDFGVVVGDAGPGVAGSARQSDGAHPSVQPTTTQRVSPEPEVDHLPPVALSYPEIAAAGAITACPAGTELRRDERAGEQFCVLVGTETRHGPYLRLYGTGSVHDTGPYRGGQRHGDWSEYHRNGKLAGTWRWTDGQPGGRVDQ